MTKYDPKNIESKWQENWEKTGIYKNYSREKKFYALDMFPYPSGVGLHVGHPKGYIATDVVSRFKMLNGYSVLHPMGWDAFGLPAENYALKMKMHPRVAVEKNIATFKKQLEMFGFTYDWDCEINTTDPEYYKWTQWAFLKMFEKGLAYESNEPVNWCPSCKTVLSNEDLENGLCERCGTQVIQRRLRQWVLKMTAYADRLLHDLDSKELNWEDSIIQQQKNWIGRSEGVQFELKINNSDEKIEVYTTRIDTAFGITYAVVAPEHAIIQKLKDKISNYGEVEKYIIAAQNKTNLERTELQKEKTGVKLKGIEVINPFTKEAVPLFVADYVLGGYGTGAVMAVPAHDERDFEFAKKYDLPIKRVVEPKFIAGSDSPSAVKLGEEFVKRNAVVAIVRNPKDDTYLCISWKTTYMHGLVTGGIDDGENIEQAAKREVLEETGYKNLKTTNVSDIAIHSLFYHRVKEQNRWARFQYVFFDLESEERDTVNEKEASLHEVVWKKKDELEDFFSVIEGKFVVDLINNVEKAYTDDGVLYNSENFDWEDCEQARKKMTAWLEKEKIGGAKVNYKMRDWVFSRQKYWGEPIPIIHCEKCGAVAVPEDQLPVTLPEVESYESTDTGESPLANITNWVNTTCPKCGQPAKRETNTMPQWAGSSWYYLRYIDSKNDKALVDLKKEKEWMPVDLYVGGAEHATRHLLYARFWHKFLYDIGVVSTIEPFKKFTYVGLILAEDGRKMSKRWNNVINPDDVIAEFGADSMRLYEMFMGPFTQSVAWSTRSVSGVRKFLEKVWKIYEERIIEDDEKIKNGNCFTALRDGNDLMERQREQAKKEIKIMERSINKTIKKVTEDIENFKFNTAISELMIFANAATNFYLSKERFEKYLILLSPFAPHITEELWNKLGNKESIFLQSWPQYDEALLKDEEIEMVVQVNGKVRERLMVAPDVTEDEVKETALESAKVKVFTDGKEIKKIIFIPEKLINIVVE